MTKIMRLPNGITVINEERPASGKVAIHVMIKSGSGHESDAENGLTNLMQEATQGGTTTRSHDQIFELLQEAGGSLGSSTGPQGTNFSTSVLASKAEESFAVIADVLRNPVFAPEEVESTKTMLKRFMLQAEQSPGAIMSRTFSQQVFAGQAVSNPSDGTAEKLDGFTVEQVKAKHAELLSNPSNIYVSISGQMDDATAEKMVAKYFGDLPASNKGPNANAPAKFVGGDARISQENEQLNFAFGFEAPDKNSPDKYAMVLLKQVLAGGMSAPLFQEVREKRGLVYTVGAQYSPTDNSGLFAISGGAGKGNIGELISVTFDLLGNSMREGFTQKSLDEARERYMRAVIGSTETPDDAAQSNLGSVVDRGRIVQPEELEAKLKQVTPEDLQRVLYNMLNSGKYAMSAVGPQDTMPTEQEMKDMMKAQVEGFTPPVAKPVATPLSATFTAAAAKAEVAESEPQVTVLPNGIKVVTQTRPGNLSAGAWVGAGSDHETADINGATHMLEHMVFKGTPNWPAGTIDRYVEGDLGGGLNAYTTRDKTAYYYFNLKPEALDKIIEISGEMVFFPILDHDEFNGKTVTKKDGTSVKNKGERDVVIEELRRANDGVGSRKADLLMTLAYPDQPHGWTILGPESTLRQMTVGDLKTFHDTHYASNNVIFSAVGPVKHEDVVALVEAKFGHLKPAPVPELPETTYKGGTGFEEYNKAKLVNITIAADGVSSTDPDNAAYGLLGGIIGGGQTSRLYKEVVTERELAAGIGAGMQDYRNSGTFMISTSVAAQDVKETMNVIFETLRDVATNGVTPGELARVKAAMQMAILSTYESNDSAVNENAVNLQAFGKLVKPADIAAEFDKVTAADVQRLAAKLLAQNPTAAGIVPVGTDKSLLPTHAETVAMRDGTWKAPANENQPKAKPPAAKLA